MVAAVDIANGALQRLGEPPIGSLDDPTERARALDRSLPIVRDRALAMGLWSFARHQVTLPALAGAPPLDYVYRYQLPADFISLIIHHSQAGYERQGAELFSDAAPPLTITYVRRVEAAELWSPLFAELVEVRSAIRVAPAIKGSGYDTRSLLAAEVQTLAQARRAAGRQELPRELSETSWAEVRYR